MRGPFVVRLGSVNISQKQNTNQKMQDAEVDTATQPRNAVYLVLIPASQGASFMYLHTDNE